MLGALRTFTSRYSELRSPSVWSPRCIFPATRCSGLDPIYQSVVDPVARQRLIATYDHDVTQPEYATGYRWDIVVAGSRRTWAEPNGDHG